MQQYSEQQEKLVHYLHLCLLIRTDWLSQIIGIELNRSTPIVMSPEFGSAIPSKSDGVCSWKRKEEWVGCRIQADVGVGGASEDGGSTDRRWWLPSEEADGPRTLWKGHASMRCLKGNDGRRDWPRQADHQRRVRIERGKHRQKYREWD